MNTLFYLDGVNRLHEVVHSYFYIEDKEHRDVFNQEILLRITLPVQCALTIIFAVNLHVHRGLSSVVSGILTLDGYKVITGLCDILSLVVDACAVSILTAIAMIIPKKSIWLMKKLHTHYEEPLHSHEILKILCLSINGFVRGIFALPLLMVEGTILAISETLCNGKNVATNMSLVFFSIFMPFVGGFAACNKNLNTNIHRPYLITLV